jgi:hypothetical protein
VLPRQLLRLAVSSTLAAAIQIESNKTKTKREARISSCDSDGIPSASSARHCCCSCWWRRPQASRAAATPIHLKNSSPSPRASPISDLAARSTQEELLLPAPAATCPAPSSAPPRRRPPPQQRGTRPLLRCLATTGPSAASRRSRTPA